MEKENFFSSDPGNEYYIEDKHYPIEPVEGTKNGYIVYDNVYLPTFVKDLESVKDFQFLTEDTIVVGYPKSGSLIRHI